MRLTSGRKVIGTEVDDNGIWPVCCLRGIPDGVLIHVEGLAVSVRHVVTRTEIVIIAGYSLTGVAYEVVIRIEIPGRDCCIGQCTVLRPCLERVVF